MLLIRDHVYSTSADMTLRMWSVKALKCVEIMETAHHMACLLDHQDDIWIGTEGPILRLDPTVQ